MFQKAPSKIGKFRKAGIGPAARLVLAHLFLIFTVGGFANPLGRVYEVEEQHNSNNPTVVVCESNHGVRAACGLQPGQYQHDSNSANRVRKTRQREVEHVRSNWLRGDLAAPMLC